MRRPRTRLNSLRFTRLHAGTHIRLRFTAPGRTPEVVMVTIPDDRKARLRLLSR